MQSKKMKQGDAELHDSDSGLIYCNLGITIMMKLHEGE